MKKASSVVQVRGGHLRVLLSTGPYHRGQRGEAADLDGCEAGVRANFPDGPANLASSQPPEPTSSRLRHGDAVCPLRRHGGESTAPLWCPCAGLTSCHFQDDSTSEMFRESLHDADNFDYRLLDEVQFAKSVDKVRASYCAHNFHPNMVMRTYCRSTCWRTTS